MAKDQKNKKTTSNRFKVIEWIYANLPFICFVCVLLLVYIANAHQAEKKVRQIQALKKEIRELNYQYRGVKNQIMYGSTPSQVADKVKKMDLKVSEELPKKINIKREKK